MASSLGKLLILSSFSRTVLKVKVHAVQVDAVLDEEGATYTCPGGLFLPVTFAALGHVLGAAWPSSN